MEQPRDQKGRFLSFAQDDELMWVERDLHSTPDAKEAVLLGVEIKGFGTIYGGSYTDCPPFLKGIKLAPEIKGECDYEMPVKDFGVPEFRDMEDAVLWGIETLYKYGALYAGCMLGQGRTGTYMACLLKALGYAAPIHTVRGFYNQKAVETHEQEQFVKDFPAEKFHYLVKVLQSNGDSPEG